MDVNKEKFLKYRNTRTNQMIPNNQNNPTKREWWECPWKLFDGEAWLLENFTDLILVLDPKKIMEPRLNYKQPRSFGIYLALTLIKKFANLRNTGQSQDTDSQRRGIIICSNGIRLETKHRTHIEQISYIEIWQSPTYNVPQIVWGT